jgi:hypothetical protein
MRRILIYLILIVSTVFLVILGALLLRGNPSDPTPEPGSAEFDCCQCTALGKDQHNPFPRVPGETCEDHCFQGCLERGYSKLECTLGFVGGYALVCPDVVPPTVTPFGE